MAEDNCDSGQCPPSEDPMDAKTFTPPARVEENLSQTPSIVIEFCNRCRWLHRATWVQTELFLTFPDTPVTASEEKTQTDTQNGIASAGERGGKYSTNGTGLKAIMLIPCNAPETGGRFRVWLYKDAMKGEVMGRKEKTLVYEDGRVVLLWDRKIKQGFPELKELKQLIRDEIAPAQKLGHSDKKAT